MSYNLSWILGILDFGNMIDKLKTLQEFSHPLASLASVARKKETMTLQGRMEVTSWDTARFFWIEKAEIAAGGVVKVISYTLGSCEIEVVVKYFFSRESSSLPSMTAPWAKTEDSNSMGCWYTFTFLLQAYFFKKVLRSNSLWSSQQVYDYRDTPWSRKIKVGMGTNNTATISISIFVL